jgi:hypothetical protein
MVYTVRIIAVTLKLVKPNTEVVWVEQWGESINWVCALCMNAIPMLDHCSNSVYRIQTTEVCVENPCGLNKIRMSIILEMFYIVKSIDISWTLASSCHS